MHTKLAVVWTAVIIIAVGTGCAGSTTDTPSATSPSSPVSTTSPPSPTPEPPSKAEDTAALKRATVTAADLGKPWVEPKKVPSVG